MVGSEEFDRVFGEAPIPKAKVKAFLEMLDSGRTRRCTACGTDFWFVRLPISGSDGPFTGDLENHAAVHARCMFLDGYTTRYEELNHVKRLGGRSSETSAR